MRLQNTRGAGDHTVRGRDESLSVYLQVLQVSRSAPHSARGKRVSRYNRHFTETRTVKMYRTASRATLPPSIVISLQQQAVFLPVQVVRHAAEFREQVLARDSRREGPDGHLGTREIRLAV